MRYVCFSFMASLAFAVAPSAFAGGGGCGGLSAVEHIFEAADADQSGSLTPDEYEAAGLSRFGVDFDESDLDGDGITTFDEYLDLYDMHHPPHTGSEV